MDQDQDGLRARFDKEKRARERVMKRNKRDVLHVENRPVDGKKKTHTRGLGRSTVQELVSVEREANSGGGQSSAQGLPKGKGKGKNK